MNICKYLSLALAVMIDAKHNTGFKIISSASMPRSLILINDLDQPKLMCSAVLSKNAVFFFTCVDHHCSLATICGYDARNVAVLVMVIRSPKSRL